jgi:hypothetical protein
MKKRGKNLSPRNRKVYPPAKHHGDRNPKYPNPIQLHDAKEL